MSCPAVVKVTVPSGPAVVRVVSPGPRGLQGEPGPAAEGFVFNQPTAAATWTINHNLGFRPSVELFNSGSQEIEADVFHPSENQSVVVFTVPVAGFARLT